MLTPASSTGYATEVSSVLSHSGTDHNNIISPLSISRSISGTSATAAYPNCGPSKAFSPPTKKEYLSSVKDGGPPDLRFALYAQASEQTHQWQGSQHHMEPTHYQQVGGGNLNTRNSWDGSSYLDTSSPVTMAASASAGHGNRQSGSYSSRDMTASGRLSMSESEGSLHATQQPSQQMPSS